MYNSSIVTTINGLNRFIPILIRIIQNNNVNQKIYHYNYLILYLFVCVKNEENNIYNLIEKQITSIVKGN